MAVFVSPFGGPDEASTHSQVTGPNDDGAVRICARGMECMECMGAVLMHAWPADHVTERMTLDSAQWWEGRDVTR